MNIASFTPSYPHHACEHCWSANADGGYQTSGAYCLLCHQLAVSRPKRYVWLCKDCLLNADATSHRWELKVVMAADNGRPKIVQIGSWRTGVVAARMIIHTAERAVEVFPIHRITAREWHENGLSFAAVEKALAFVRETELEALEGKA